MTQILSDEEVNELWGDSFIGADPTSGNQRFKFTKLVEAAILKKLNVMELPEKVVIDTHESGIVIRGYTADQLRQVYAQGAAAQLSKEHEPSKENLLTLLATVRDMFPLPTKGSELEFAWAEAVSSPEAIPNYVAAYISQHQLTAKTNKKSFGAASNKPW